MYRSLLGRESLGNRDMPFVAHSDKYRDFLEKALQSKSHSVTSECYKQPTSRLQPPKQLLKFKRLKTLGQGAHSSVYLVQQAITKTVYALKVIDKETMRKHMSLLQQQIKILLRLKHENIIQLYHIFTDEHGINLVLEYGEQTLFNYIRRKGRLSEKEAGRIIGQILSALDYLHRLGITHRDMKLQNILLVNVIDQISQGLIKVCDFGFAKTRKIFDSSSELLGTMGYLSPQIVGSEHYTHKTDIWAAGVILYEMITGKSFLDKMNDKQKYLYIKNFSPSNIRFEGSFELQAFLRRIFNWQEMRPEAYELLKDPFIRMHAD